MFSDFFSHLEELRRRLLICLLVFLALSAGGWVYSEPLLDFSTLPLRRLQNVDLYFYKPYEAFLVHIKVAALSGFLFSLPVFLTQLWQFAVPGLYEREKKILLPLILISTVLFLAGAAFAYFVVVPIGLNFLLGFRTESLQPLLGIGAYFSFLTGMILAFGILFNLPVAVVGLTRFGVVKSRTLAESRKVIVVLIFVAAAILTPSPDPVSQILLALPLFLIFEISLWIVRKMESGKRSGPFFG